MKYGKGEGKERGKEGKGRRAEGREREGGREENRISEVR